MRTVGIIAEYNPFHTGHAYHIEKAKEISQADYAIVVMSPDFVQRGEPAVFDKYARARMALQNGADLVLELPVRYATASAEYFALGAVTLLDRLGVVDTLCFGAEQAVPELFDTVAAILSAEPPEYTENLRRLLRQGKTFPQARSEALLYCLCHGGAAGNEAGPSVSAGESFPDIRNLSDFLSAPNNILGVEYCKALRHMKSHIRPIPIRREGSPYHSTVPNGAYCSAASIRQGLCAGNVTDHVQRYIPENCHNLFLEASGCVVTQEELLPFLTQKLLALDSFDSIFDLSSDLSDRIRNLRFDCIGKTYGQIVSLLKCRQITEAHIRRALIHLILDIRDDDIRTGQPDEMIRYAKVLGLRKSAAPVLHQIKENNSLPFLTKPAHASCLTDAFSIHMWKQDLFASHLYRSIQVMRTHNVFRSEYEISPLII